MPSHPITPACAECHARLRRLTAKLSALTEENANLKLLDDVMRRNNALFEALLANSSAGITLTGPDRRIVRVVHGLLGYGPGDIDGVTMESFVIPEDRGLVVECYRRLLQDRCQTITRIIRFKRANGTVAWFDSTITDMLDDPNVQGIVWNYTDITALKEAELAAARSELFVG